MKIHLVLKPEYVEAFEKKESILPLDTLVWCIESWGGKLLSKELKSSPCEFFAEVEDDDRIIPQLLATGALDGAYVKPPESCP